jgi:hypothetical protein
MEFLSILDWKTNSADIAKTLQDATNTQMERVKEMVKQVKPGDFSLRDTIFFAYVQLIPGVLNMSAAASVRANEILTDIQVLNIRLERLTKWLIGLTIALVLLTVVLLIVTLKPTR